MMGKRFPIYLLSGIWLAAFLGSLVVTRSLDEIDRFVSWQVAALAIALAACLMTRSMRRRLRGRDRTIGYIPIGVSGTVALVLLTLAATGR